MGMPAVHGLGQPRDPGTFTFAYVRISLSQPYYLGNVFKTGCFGSLIALHSFFAVPRLVQGLWLSRLGTGFESYR